MPLAPISIPPGVVRPATPLQAKGRYWDANLIRWRSGKLLPVGGWQRITDSPLDSTPRAIFSWADTAGANFLAVGCDDDLYVMESSVFTNVTPSAFVGSTQGQYGGFGAYLYGQLLYGDDTDPTYPRPVSNFNVPVFSWSFDNWGEDLLAVASSDGRLLHWAPTEGIAHEVGKVNITSAARVSNVVTVTTAWHHDYAVGDVVTIAGNSVAAFNATWTIASVPSDTTFTFSDSGTNTTGTGGTASIPGIPQNNRAVIVTPERHVVLLGAGGNPRRVGWSSREDYSDWDFASSTNTAGYLDLDTQTKLVMCAPVREGTLIWTDDEAWLMRFIGLPYIYSIERIGYGCGLMSPRSFATTAGRCIWMGRESFWIYDGGVVKPLTCDVGSYVFDNIDPTAGFLYSHGSENGLFPEAWFWFPSPGSDVPDLSVFYNYSEGWWGIGNTMTRTAACGAGVFDYPIASDENNDLFEQENGWNAAGTPIENGRYGETGSLNIQNGNVISFLRRAITDSGYGYDSTQITVYSSFTPEGQETTSGPYNPRSDGYTDMRVTGRDFRMRISATDDAPWSIGEMRIDFLPKGGR